MAFDSSTLRRDYGDPEREAHACRTDCALFDFSFVRRARLEGPGALDAIAQLTRRPLSSLLRGQIRYALRADSNGHLLSDLTLWKHGEARYDLMSGRSEDIADLIRAAWPGCEVEDLSTRTSIIALQGPNSLQALAGLTDIGALGQLSYSLSCRSELPMCPASSAGSAIPASQASRSCCRAPRRRNSGRCWRDGRAPPALPPPTCCASKRASCCSPTSFAFP